ncbi:formate dehydrogenase accessory sulfurtransferase FdhD [Candidatus Bipolaricaulota bacterium]
METTEQIPIQRLQAGKVEAVNDTLVVEQNVAIELDDEILFRTTCSPGELGEWVLGYLFSEGLIASPEDVDAIHNVDGAFSVRLVRRAHPEPPPRVTSNLVVGTDRLLAAAGEIVGRARVFEETGGTHAMAIANQEEILTLVEDVSRTCALEKAIGEALLKGIDFAQSFAFLSSRVPSRMIAKLARCGVPIVAAVSAPTIDAVRLAEELNVSLCGFVRGERLNVYTHSWRVDL